MLKKEWLEIRAIEKGQLLIKEAEKDIIKKIKKLEARYKISIVIIISELSMYYIIM